MELLRHVKGVLNNCVAKSRGLQQEAACQRFCFDHILFLSPN